MFPMEIVESVQTPLNYPEALREHHTLLLRDLANEAYAAWGRSCEEQRRVRITRGRTARGRGGEQVPLPDLEVIEVLPGKGDPRYLAQARAALADVRKLWSMDGPPAPPRAAVEPGTAIEEKCEGEEHAPDHLVTDSPGSGAEASAGPDLLSLPEAGGEASEPPVEGSPPDAACAGDDAALRSVPQGADRQALKQRAERVTERFSRVADRSPPGFSKPRCGHPQCHGATDDERKLTDVRTV